MLAIEKFINVYDANPDGDLEFLFPSVFSCNLVQLGLLK